MDARIPLIEGSLNVVHQFTQPHANPESVDYFQVTCIGMEPYTGQFDGYVRPQDQQANPSSGSLWESVKPLCGIHVGFPGAWSAEATAGGEQSESGQSPGPGLSLGPGLSAAPAHVYSDWFPSPQGGAASSVCDIGKPQQGNSLEL